MYCPKCNKQYPDNVKFCSVCGTALSETLNAQTIQLRCKNCDGVMNVDSEHSVLACPFCSSKELILESDNVKIEKVRQKAYTDVELGKQQLERERMQYQREWENKNREQAELYSFKKGKFKTVLVVFAIISALLCAVSFNGGKVLSGILAVAMCGMFIGALLVGMKVIKPKFKGMHYLIAVLGFALIVPYFMLYSSGGNEKAVNFSWSEVELGEMLPVPQRTYGEIFGNSKTYVSVSLNDVTKNDYDSYVAACIDKGYNIETDEGTNSYEAFNSEGYKIRVSYYESLKEISIHLDAPMEMAEFEWTQNGIGAELPPTKSTWGKVESNSSKGYTVYVGNMTKEDFAAYVKECQDAGFNVDYELLENYYSACNEKGDKLSISYKGFKVVRIQISSGEESNEQENSVFDAESEGTVDQSDETVETVVSIYDELTNDQFKVLTELLAKCFYSFTLANEDANKLTDDPQVETCLNGILNYAHANYFELDPQYREAAKGKYDVISSIPNYEELKNNFTLEHYVDGRTGKDSFIISSYSVDPQDVLICDEEIYIDAEGYLKKGTELYWEEDGVMEKVAEVVDVARNKEVNGVLYGYAINIKYYDDPYSSGWHDGENVLRANKNLTGKPLFYVRALDPNRQIAKECIDYNNGILWERLNADNVKIGTEVYMGMYSAKSYVFVIVEANPKLDTMTVKYPNGSIEVKSYSAIINNTNLYTKQV